MIFISLLLAIVCGLAYCLPTFINSKQISQTANVTRTIEVKQNEIDYQSIFDEFENAKLETEGSLTIFEGVNPISIDDLSALDNLSESDLETCNDISVKYNFSYDAETGMVTLSAITISGDSVIEVDEIQGIAFYNEYGAIDALLEVDGECVLLSEMQDAGMIANCGWFSRLFKKIVVAVVAVVVVSAVVAAVVATCGAGLGACIAAGAIAGEITLTEAYVVDFAESVRKTNRTDRYLLVVMSALDQPLVTHYKPVTLETAKTWFSLGGQVWTPYSNDAIGLINSCGYAAGDSKKNIGVPERNILSNGLYGNWHYHAIDPTTKNKIRLPGDGQNGNVGKAHAVHCFFYYNV